MNILGLSQRHSGCGYHRVVLPLGFMDDVNATVTNMPTDEMIDNNNILFYNRISVIDKNIHVLKDKGYKIIVDMDDDWILPANHLNANDYENLRPQIEENISRADLVTCTNERLYKKLKQLNPKVEIFPNALPYGYDQFTDTKKESDKVRIFWCGSITHEHDLALLKYPLRRLKMHKDIEMVLGGFNSNNDYAKWIWFKMWNNFTSNNLLPNIILPSLDPTEYISMYENADICVIPLEDSDWHSCKSNLKILEAAVKKIPVVVSAVEPYINDKDAPVFWVEKQSDWFTHLNDLILNKNKRIEYGEKIHEWAKAKYNLLDVNRARRECFESIRNA